MKINLLAALFEAVAILTLLLIIIRYIAYKILVQKVFSNDHAVSRNPGDLGLPYENIELVVNQRKLQAWMVPATKNSYVKSAILIFHGQGETISRWLEVQKYLSEHGVTSMIFDYSAYGNSTGDSKIEHLQEDALAAYQFFSNKLSKDTHKYVLGFSLGTGILVEAFANSDASPAGLILAEPFSSIRELAVSSGMISGRLAFIIPDVFNNLKTIKQLNNPLLIVHSKTDEIVPFQQAQRLYKAANTPKQLIIQENFKHNDIWRTPTDEYWQPIIQFVKNEAPVLKENFL